MVENINGLLVLPKDSTALAERIIYLPKNDNLRKGMGEKSHKMTKQYNWKITTKRYVEVYEEVLDRRKALF